MGCQPQSEPQTTTKPTEAPLSPFVDYASQLKLNMGSETAKLKDVTVKLSIDGDTVHFHVDDPQFANGVLKGRFLAIDTPESTGKIEEWGKKASNFTKEKMAAATSIVLESNGATWEADSTGERYMVWVWYKTAEMTEYRNLNLELLQNGLANVHGAGSTRYGSICTSAMNQARAYKMNLYSPEKDPDFYYGTAIELDLRELSTNVSNYAGMAVAFTGIVTRDYNDGVYVESLDEETGINYGMYVYYSKNLSGTGRPILEEGNMVRIVGTVTEFSGSWQVSGVTHDAYAPNDPKNLVLISKGHSPAYTPVTAETFFSKVSLEVNGEEGPEMKELPWCRLALNSSVSMTGLTVKEAYTTDNGGNSDGAMTLTCEVDGQTVSIRTAVLRDGEQVVTAERFTGKTIDVKGFVDFYNDTYQVMVLSMKDITIHN